MANIELTFGQRALLIWQVVIGLIGLVPAGYLLFIGSLLVADILFPHGLYSSRLYEAVLFVAICLIVLAGLVLWICYWLLLFRPSMRHRSLRFVSIGTLIVNPIIAVLWWMLCAITYNPDWPLYLMPVYPLLITFWWYGVFGVQSGKKQQLATKPAH